MPIEQSFHLNGALAVRAAFSIGIALCLVSCSESAPQTSITEAASDVPASGTATSILNAGVMAQIGGADGASVKFLFDPLYDDHFGSLQQLPPELIEAIVSGAPPYDGVNAVFVSHAHGDHFSATHLTRMLASQPQVQLVAPGQAIDRMREDANWQAGFEGRVTAITLENGETAQGTVISGAYVEAFRSPHAGWPDRHAATHNITFRVSAAGAGEGSGEGDGGGASARIMHLGDADPAAEHFAALSEFLSAKRTGLAAVPFWFYGEDGLSAIIDETLNAQSAVAVHVPVNAPGYLEAGERPYFSGVGEVLEIPAVE